MEDLIWRIIEKNVEKTKSGEWKSLCVCTKCNEFQKVILNKNINKAKKNNCPICKQREIEYYIGMRFTKLVVLEFSHQDKNHMKYYKCQCDCGNQTVSCLSKLKNGETKSCGCYSRELCHEKTKTHGMTKTRLYKIYSNMKARCYNINNSSYSEYGSRGIKICDYWLEDFMNFYNDMHDSYDEHCKIYGEENTSIDRIDVNGNYTKENCRWATWLVQANNKQDTIYVNIYGRDYTARELSNFCGLSDKTIRYLYHTGNLEYTLENMQSTRYAVDPHVIQRIPKYISPIDRVDNQLINPIKRTSKHELINPIIRTRR